VNTVKVRVGRGVEGVKGREEAERKEVMVCDELVRAHASKVESVEENWF